MTISGRDAAALRRARMIQIELRKLRRELDEQRTVALRSLPLDGMPGRCADAERMTARLIRIEKMERRESALLRMAVGAQEAAQRVCRRMTDQRMRLFFETYYADAQAFETAIRTAGVAQRTACRYRQMAGDATDACPPMTQNVALTQGNPRDKL